MAINKVVYGATTLVDLTGDTVTAATLASGATAHDRSGALVTGSLSFVTYYTGSSAPSSSLGQNGDIYLQS